MQPLQKKSVVPPSLTLVGTVVGAGFISGKELLFFLGGFSLRTAILATACFFLIFFTALSFGKRYGGFDGVLSSVFKKASPFVQILFVFSSFVTASGMLSAVRNVIPLPVPALPCLLLVSGVVALKYGVSGIEKINLFLTPTLVANVLVLVFLKNAVSPPQPTINTFGAIFYVCINGFTCFPVLCELGRSATKPERIKISALASFLLFLCIVLVSTAVCSDKRCFSAPLPLEYVLKGGTLFSLLVCTGMATTFYSAFFPLYMRFKKNVLQKILLCLILFLCSYIPFSTFVEKIYPVFGVFGGIIYAWLLVDGTLRKTNTKPTPKRSGSKISI